MKYAGEWKNDKWHGQGTITYADGGTYTGGFKRNKKHGQGIAVFVDGSAVKGVWKDGEVVKKSSVLSSSDETSLSEWLSIAQQGFDMMSGTSSTGSSASQTCFKTGEVKQAFNKICNYKCGLTTYTTNLGTGVGLCPSTIQR